MAWKLWSIQQSKQSSCFATMSSMKPSFPGRIWKLVVVFPKTAVPPPPLTSSLSELAGRPSANRKVAQPKLPVLITLPCWSCLAVPKIAAYYAAAVGIFIQNTSQSTLTPPQLTRSTATNKRPLHRPRNGKSPGSAPRPPPSAVRADRRAQSLPPGGPALPGLLRVRRVSV